VNAADIIELITTPLNDAKSYKIKLRCSSWKDTYKDMYEKKKRITRSHKERKKGLKGRRGVIKDNKREEMTTNKIHLSIMSQLIKLYMSYQMVKLWLAITPFP